MRRIRVRAEKQAEIEELIGDYRTYAPGSAIMRVPDRAGLSLI